MTDPNKQVDRAGKLRLIALVLFIVLPAYAIGGWMIFLASEEQPWLMSFSFVLVVLVLLMWPLEF